MADLDYQDTIQKALKGTIESEADALKGQRSPQIGLFDEGIEEPKKVKKETHKKEKAAEKRGVQSDMFEKELKDLKRAESDKKFQAQQKLEERPLPKYHRAPSGGGGMKPDTDITASKKLPKMAKGGSVSSASKRADGIAQRGKTRGKFV